MTAAISRRAALLGGAATWAATSVSHAAPTVIASSGLVPRHVLALYDGAIEAHLKETSVHGLAAMPLEWLGLTLDYHDIRQGLPPIWADPRYRGVLTWFPEPNIADYAAYVVWIERVAAAGLRVVQVGDTAPAPGRMTAAEEAPLRRRMFAAFGIRASGQWSAVTLGDRVIKRDAAGTEFETRFDAGLPAYEIYAPGRSEAASWLIVARADQARSESHLVVVSPAGGFIAPGYAVSSDAATGVKQWFVDPFAFFAEAFATHDLPAPDTTTLCGRRVYYSHIDGDGWRSMSQVRAPGRAPSTNAEIVLQAVAAHPELPVTVAPIAAEMDPAFAGDLRAIGAARALFRLAHVEAATHTYTHPFRWQFFEDYSERSEQPFQEAYHSAESGHAQIVDTSGAAAGPAGCCGRVAKGGVAAPRAFGGRPFDLDEEVSGSVKLIDAIAAPTGKRVRLLQWPGDCTPFPKALRTVAAAGLLNINGGDTRCDREFPSVSAVAPLGFRRDNVTQVYASNSSEELYTDLWTDRYFGFRDLPETWDRTEAPRRLKPINLYYHMYSGERRASLDALVGNMSAAQARGGFIAVFASRFAAAADGFFTLTLTREGPAAWRVRDRGGLQSLRFARGLERMLDVDASVGVLGARVINSDLYVALDPAVESPLVALASRREVAFSRAALLQSSWEVSGLAAYPDRAAFTVQGFGPGVMEWLVPPGRWMARAGDEAREVAAGADGVLRLDWPAIAVSPLQITLERLG